MNIIKINPAEIVLDMTIYPRTDINQETIMRMKEAKYSGVEFPPIVIDAASRICIDGVHRVHMAKQLKLNEIEADARKYKSRAEMLADSGQLNANHGRPFSSQDCRRFILLASDAGLSKGQIAQILNITKERVEEWTAQRATYKSEEIPIKRGLQNELVGRKLTESQKRLNEKWGGMNATFYINQLILYIGAGVVNSGNVSFIEKMDLLVKLWEKTKEKIK